MSNLTVVRRMTVKRSLDQAVAAARYVPVILFQRDEFVERNWHKMRE